MSQAPSQDIRWASGVLPRHEGGTADPRMKGQEIINLLPDDHVIGPDSTPATVVAYCDFECPYCGQSFLSDDDRLEELVLRAA